MLAINLTCLERGNTHSLPRQWVFPPSDWPVAMCLCVGTFLIADLYEVSQPPEGGAISGQVGLCKNCS